MGPVEPESSEAYVLSVTRGVSCWGRVYGRLGRLRKPDLTPPRMARQLYKTKAVDHSCPKLRVYIPENYSLLILILIKMISYPAGFAVGYVFVLLIILLIK